MLLYCHSVIYSPGWEVETMCKHTLCRLFSVDIRKPIQSNDGQLKLELLSLAFWQWWTMLEQSVSARLQVSTRVELGCVWILVQSYPARKLSLGTANNIQQRHSLPCSHTYTRGMDMGSCGAGNASTAYDWHSSVTASGWDSSGRFRLVFEHAWVHP